MLLVSTPPARILAWITSIYFWMKPMSGYNVSCHQAMQDKTLGINVTTLIVNGAIGCGGNFDPTNLPSLPNREPIEPGALPVMSTAGGLTKVFTYLQYCKLLNITPLPVICPAPPNCNINNKKTC